jgi:hypothetical protein
LTQIENKIASVGEEFFTGKYADPSTCSYLYYPCVYCEELFQLIDPENDKTAELWARKLENKF